MSSSLTQSIKEYNCLHDKKKLARTIINIKLQCSQHPDKISYKELKKYMIVMKREIVDKVYDFKRIMRWMDEGKDPDEFYRIYGDDY